MTSDLASRYRRTLSLYLQTEDESALEEAYEIGRSANREGIGLLEISTVHCEAVTAALPRGLEQGTGLKTIRMAADFFRECVSPYEMSYRGYQEANATLRGLNASLEKRTRELEFLTKELESFNYSVSHDLRGPVCAVAGLGQIVLDDFGDRLEPPVKEHVQRIQDSAEKMKNLIDDLLRLSRLTHAEVRRDQIDLSAMAESIASGLTVSCARNVEFAISPGVRAKGDAGFLRQVLENLIGNAWKFTINNPHGKIEFGVMEKEGRPAFFVRDNGVGFEMKEADRLFTPFHRLPSSSHFPGTGIGLAIVQRIILRHGGKVWAEGAPNRGATFYFTLET